MSGYNNKLIELEGKLDKSSSEMRVIIKDTTEKSTARWAEVQQQLEGKMAIITKNVEDQLTTLRIQVAEVAEKADTSAQEVSFPIYQP
jgi:DNA anti-recombination protein RmuC